MLNIADISKKQCVRPRLVHSRSWLFWRVWVAEGARCPCGALISWHPRENDDGAELICAEHHTVVRFERV